MASRIHIDSQDAERNDVVPKRPPHIRKIPWVGMVRAWRRHTSPTEAGPAPAVASPSLNLRLPYFSFSVPHQSHISISGGTFPGHLTTFSLGSERFSKAWIHRICRSLL